MIKTNMQVKIAKTLILTSIRFQIIPGIWNGKHRRVRRLKPIKRPTKRSMERANGDECCGLGTYFSLFCQRETAKKSRDGTGTGLEDVKALNDLTITRQYTQKQWRRICGMPVMGIGVDRD